MGNRNGDRDRQSEPSVHLLADLNLDKELLCGRLTSPWISFTTVLHFASSAVLICQIQTLSIVPVFWTFWLFCMLQLGTFCLTIRPWLGCLVTHIQKKNLLPSKLFSNPYTQEEFPPIFTWIIPLNKQNLIRKKMNKWDLIRILSCLYLLCLLSHPILSSSRVPVDLHVGRGKVAFNMSVIKRCLLNLGKYNSDNGTCSSLAWNETCIQGMRGKG